MNSIGLYRLVELVLTSSAVQPQDRRLLRRELNKCMLPAVALPTAAAGAVFARQRLPLGLRPFLEPRRAALWFVPLWLLASYVQQAALVRQLQPLAEKYAAALAKSD